MGWGYVCIELHMCLRTCAPLHTHTHTHKHFQPPTQIRRCKDVIRECLRACEQVEGETPIPPESFDEEGEVHEADIFCAVCKSGECTEVGCVFVWGKAGGSGVG